MNQEEKAQALRKEYRATIPHDVLHLWAKDALVLIDELESEVFDKSSRIADLEAQLSAIGAGGVESLRKRDGQQPQAWLVYLPSCDAQNVYDSRDDIGYIDDLTNNDDAVVTPLYAALQAEPTQAYSIDADPQGIRAYVADAITGALACGAQGSGTPPPDHWLTPFWRQARFGQIQHNALRDATDALPNAPGAAQEHATQLAGQGRLLDAARDIQEMWDELAKVSRGEQVTGPSPSAMRRYDAALTAAEQAMVAAAQGPVISNGFALPMTINAEMAEAWASAPCPDVDGMNDEEANFAHAQANWSAMLAAAPAQAHTQTAGAPSREEIASLRASYGITSNGRGIKEFEQVACFARDVLARWGAAPVQAQEDARAVDADGEAFRTAANLGLTLRFYGGCAQSGMPGSVSVYEVEPGADRAEAMRAAINRAAARAAQGGAA